MLSNTPRKIVFREYTKEPRTFRAFYCTLLVVNPLAHPLNYMLLTLDGGDLHLFHPAVPTIPACRRIPTVQNVWLRNLEKGPRDTATFRDAVFPLRNGSRRGTTASYPTESCRVLSRIYHQKHYAVGKFGPTRRHRLAKIIPQAYFGKND